MNRAFLEEYNRELGLLYERAKAFAVEFPGIAERLGGLGEEAMDPGVKGLLEGTAFMAARVQLKLKSEFATFTTALLDQIMPGFLAPIPSVALVAATPGFDDPEGEARRFPAGSAVDAAYVERDRRIACRYRTTAELAVWPLHLEAAYYLANTAALQALKLDVAPGTASGLRLVFQRRTRQPAGPSEPDEDPGAPLKDLGLDILPLHLVGPAGDAGALYELLFSACRRISFCEVDAFGDRRFFGARPNALTQIGFAPDEGLFGRDDRVFSGFELLREFSVFPQKFLGFALSGLGAVLPRLKGSRFEVLFEFDTAIPRLQSLVTAQSFALHAVPVVNLFEMTCSRVPLRTEAHEHPVLPDRSRPLDFEAHRVLDVFAHYPRSNRKTRVFPLYSVPSGNAPVTEALFYATRRLPRRPSAAERRDGARSAYAGGELFLSLNEPPPAPSAERARELSVRCLVSNRHLTEHLPVGAGGADFVLVDDTSLALRCIGRPTPPRESVIDVERPRPGAPQAGRQLWTLVNLLALNHLGLTTRSSDDRARGLRELLSIFADLSDVVSERRIRGVVAVDSRPIVRRLAQAGGFNAARGIEVRVLLDETAFEGSGVFLFGAVLDRFLADYAPVNSFTETVIETQARGLVKRWPPRSGTGLVL